MANLHQDVRPSEARADRVRSCAVATLLALATAASAEAQETKGPKGLTKEQYEGWRQYSVHCARCHGQDALPNPVAANLLESLAPAGPMHSQNAFTEVVTTGRVERGMPAFGKTLEAAQITAVYSYLVGRAETKISAGRPANPGGT